MATRSRRNLSVSPREICWVPAPVWAGRPENEEDDGSMAQQKSEDRVVCAGRRVLLAGESPVGPIPSGVRSQQAGVMPRRAQEDEGRDVLVHRDECAGQGAHREVGSEGFEANCRAVAELTANRSARSRRYRACTMEAKEVLGEPGRNKVFAGGTAGKQHALPREVSYSPARRGWVPGRISR